MVNQIEWKRVFIRSGFLFDEDSAHFSFKRENEYTVKYLTKIFVQLGFISNQYGFMGSRIFVPPGLTVDEGEWLTAIEQLHTGTEGGISDMYGIELEQMDTFMAGIVRWVNGAGRATSYSCDGHNRNIAELVFMARRDEILFDYFLRVVSGDRWKYRQGQLLGVRQFPRQDLGFPRSDSRHWLLEVAEKIFTKMDMLRQFVEAGHGLAPPRARAARHLGA